MEDLSFASAAEIAGRVASRSVTALRVVEACLGRIAVHDRLLNSFLNAMTDQALDAARRVDDAVRAGRPPGPLTGVPVAVKDIIDVADVPTTAGAHPRFHVVPHEDAPIVARLRAAGAVIVGKTGLHEFAYGVTNANPHTGSVRNPWDRSRSPGGSSGGSAAAVAAGFCAAALGSEIAEAIPTSPPPFGGGGLKTTHRRVPPPRGVPPSLALRHIRPPTPPAIHARLPPAVPAPP